MRVTTIEISDRQGHAVRKSLSARREDILREAGPSDGRLAELDSALAQLDTRAPGLPCELTASAATLWGAVYDALCIAAERLSGDCDDLWRGETDLSAVREQVGDVAGWLDALEAVGTSPAEAA